MILALSLMCTGVTSLLTARSSSQPRPRALRLCCKNLELKWAGNVIRIENYRLTTAPCTENYTLTGDTYLQGNKFLLAIKGGCRQGRVVIRDLKSNQRFKGKPWSKRRKQWPVSLGTSVFRLPNLFLWVMRRDLPLLRGHLHNLRRTLHEIFSFHLTNNGGMANVLDSSHAIMFSFGLILLGKAWTLLI